MAWYDPLWTKRKAITLTGGASGSFVDFQVELTVAYESDMKSDFSDIRFTKEDGETPIDAWMESYTSSTSATVWVETDTPANTVESDIYMYYGKADAVSRWDIGETFLFGDDFETGDLTTGPMVWTPVASSESGGVAIVDRDGGGYNQMYIDSDIFENAAWAFDFKKNESGDPTFLFGFISNVHDWGAFNGMYDLEISGANIYISNDRSTNLISTTWANDQLDHTFEVTRDGSGNFELFIDGVSKGTANDVEFSSSAYMVFWEHNYIEMDVDNFRVRKYAANPPTYAFGSEENAPTGLTILDFERPVMRGIMRGIMRGVA